MARKVKCQITHEIGSSDVFVKINGKYYKTREIYDDYKRESDLHKKVVNIIANDLLNYQEGQVFPNVLYKKIKELEFYPNAVILQTVENNYDNIKYWMDRKDFDSDFAKISYIFAIIKNKINDTYKEWKRNELITIQENKTNIEFNLDINEENTAQKGKDISKWLEEDEVWN
jgi:hypothetical protein